MDEIEEMDGYEDVITTVEEPEYITTAADNQSLKNVMFNFLSSNMHMPNDIASILLAAAFLIVSWKVLQIVIKFVLAVLWPIIAFSSLFFLLPLIGQEELISRSYSMYNFGKNLLFKLLRTINRTYK